MDNLRALGVSIVQRFEEMAQRHSDRLAVQDLERRLTYGELAGEARRVAAATAAAVRDRPGPVAVLAPLDASFPIAFLGVLAAGRAAVLLDPEHPAERNKRIAEHAGVAAAVTTETLMASAAELFASDTPILDLGQCGGQCGGLGADASGAAAPPGPGPDDLAYILYTSGSTGAPKGVAHTHANALNDTLGTTRICEVTVEDSTGLLYAAVMGSVRNALSALLNGAALHIMPAQRLGAEGLVREIRARGLTLLQTVPTLFRRIADAVPPGEPLDSVRIVRLIGDRSDWSDVELFRRAFRADTRFGIAIGSTECSSTYAGWFVDEALRTECSRPPVGRQMDDVEVAILDDDGEPVADGEVGEVVVSSRYLALGYWREPGLTASAFTTDPADPSVRIFATGDMCRRGPDGLIEFVGRKDQLVKLRGHRLEPAEVEAALRACPGVRDAAVVVRRTPDGRARALAAYVELEPEVKGLLSRHLLAMLSSKLPSFMVPSVIYVEPSLPRLLNYKLDRRSLAALDEQRASDHSTRNADPLLDRVARAFEAVVGCSGATGEDDLLSLGGDSLQAVQVVLEIERRLGVKVPDTVFRDSQDIAQLSAWIGSRADRRRGALA